jgi:DNA-directed RNA polymerase subunit H (RpoH/RPB5)
MLVTVTITGKLDIDEDDLPRLRKEDVLTLAAVLRDTGKDVGFRVAEAARKPKKKDGE